MTSRRFPPVARFQKQMRTTTIFINQTPRLKKVFTKTVIKKLKNNKFL